MNLYLLTQNKVTGYDTYDSCVVCAEDENEARTIHPSTYVTHFRDGNFYGTYAGGMKAGEEYENDEGAWVPGIYIDTINVEYLGEAAIGIKRSLILSSFNAG